jgi:hypothetical protein
VHIGIIMNRLAAATAITCVMFAGSRALAGEPAGQSRTGTHRIFVLMVACMKKRMSNDRSSSYNDAKKTCKDQINGVREDDSGALVASAAPPKP